MSFISDFFQDIKSLSKPKSVLGIDIGTVSIKVAELARGKNTLELLNYAILETKEYLDRGNEAIQTSSLMIDEKRTVGLMRTLLAEMKPRATTAILGIPAFTSFVTPLEMPILSAEETKNALLFQARQYIPMPISEVSIDWVKVQEFEMKKGERRQLILLIGIPNEVIRRYTQIMKDLGLRLVAFEIEGLAEVRSLLKGEKGITLLVDFGAESTNILVSRDGSLEYAKQIDYGSVSLTQAIARSLDITSYRAEDLKKRKGLLARGGETELSTLVLPFLDVILNEIGRVRDIYEHRYEAKIQNIMLVGAGANLLGINDYIGRKMNLRVSEPLPFTRVRTPQTIEQFLKELSRTLPVAIGLGERYFNY